MYNLRKRKSNVDAIDTPKKKKNKETSDSDSSYTDSDDDVSDDDVSNDENDSIDLASDSDDSMYSSGDENYDLISFHVFDCIKKLIPDTDDDVILKNIKKAINKAKDTIIAENCDLNSIFTPKDDLLKEGLNPEELETLNLKLNSLRKEIKNDEPALCKIIKANILKSDVKEAIVLYDIMKNTPRNSFNHLEVQTQINNILKTDKEIKDNDELEKFQQLENKILTKFTDYNNSLKIKILSLDASEDNKAILYDMYKDLESKKPDSDEYQSLKNKIKWYLQLPHERMKLPECAMKDKTPEDISKYCINIYHE